MPDEDPHEWLGHIEILHTVYNVTEDALKIARAAMHTKDAAFSWYCISKDEINTWSQFRNAFIARFGRNTHFSSLQDLTRCKQGTERILAYSDRLRKLLSRATITDELIKLAYILHPRSR